MDPECISPLSIIYFLNTYHLNFKCFIDNPFFEIYNHHELPKYFRKIKRL